MTDSEIREKYYATAVRRQKKLSGMKKLAEAKQKELASLNHWLFGMRHVREDPTGRYRMGCPGLPAPPPRARLPNWETDMRHQNPSPMLILGNPEGVSSKNPPAYFVIDPRTNKILMISRGGRSISAMDRAAKKAFKYAEEQAALHGEKFIVVVHPYIPPGFKKGAVVSPLFYHYGAQEFGNNPLTSYERKLIRKKSDGWRDQARQARAKGLQYADPYFSGRADEGEDIERGYFYQGNPPSVANTILQQMGGFGKLRAMIGAKNFVDHGNALSFKWPARSGPNYLKVTLDGADTYTMEFGRIRGVEYRVLKEVSGVYFDQLIPIFEETTGLYLRLGNPHKNPIGPSWPAIMGAAAAAATNPKKKKARKRKPRLTKKAQQFISRKIRKLRREGYPEDQAAAIAYDMAREAGYKVPAPPKPKRKAKKKGRKKNPKMKGIPAYIANDPKFQVELEAYRKRHGDGPIEIRKVKVPKGFPKYMSAWGKAPDVKYDANKRSNKGKRVHHFGEKGKKKPWLVSSAEKGGKFLAYAGGDFKADGEWILD